MHTHTHTLIVAKKRRRRSRADMELSHALDEIVKVEKEVLQEASNRRVAALTPDEVFRRNAPSATRIQEGREDFLRSKAAGELGRTLELAYLKSKAYL